MHKIGVRYNGQIAVDDKHKLILAQEVVNEATDHGQLAAMGQADEESPGGGNAQSRGRWGLP